MFYRNFFAGLCLIFFVIGVLTRSPYALWAVLICGAFSRTAVKKGWPDPSFAPRLRACFRLQAMRLRRLRQARKTS